MSTLSKKITIPGISKFLSPEGVWGIAANPPRGDSAEFATKRSISERHRGKAPMDKIARARASAYLEKQDVYRMFS
jgi:hypothetical protein